MAKKPISWSDFQADDPLFNEEEEVVEGQEEEQEDQEEEEESEEETVTFKAKKKKKAKKAEAEEEESEEEAKPAKKPKAKSKAPVEEEESEEEEEDEQEEEEEEQEKEEDTDQPDFNPQSFFEEVEKITGQTVEVDYKGVDPTTAQGFALREAAIRQQAIDSLLTEIEEKYPTAYKALSHAYAGGDPADLFREASSRDYSKVVIKEDDEALSKEILKDYYRSRGVKSESKIAKMIEADEDSDGGLITEARAALEEMAKEQAEKRDALVEEQKRKAAEQQKRDQVLVTAIDDVLETRRLGTFRIQDRTEAQAFRDYVLKSIRKREDGKYDLVLPLDQANLERQLQYQFFQFKQGDLSKVVQQKAATENAAKFKLRAQAEQKKIKKTSEQEARVAGGSMRDFIL